MQNFTFITVLSICLLLLRALAAEPALQRDLNAAGIKVVVPGDAEYSTASRAFNLRFTFKPIAIAYPSTPGEVSTAIISAAALKLQVVARSGGHSYIANGLGGENGVLVIDMKNFTQVVLNRAANTATIGTGNRLGDIALALNAGGRAMPHGVCPYVGIGGHSAYGGRGYTSRMWGLTLDTIKSVNIVLADGTIKTASEKVNSDLFWAVRGSGGSFGITTSIEVTTFAAPASATIFEYSWSLNVADGSKALTAFQDFVQTNIPSEWNADILLQGGAVKGNVSFGLMGGWYGPASRLNSTLAPFLTRLPRPNNVKLTVGKYIETVDYLGNGVLDTDLAPDGNDTFYAKSLMTPENSPMSPKAITAFISYLANEGFGVSTQWFLQVELYGGPNSATNAIASDATSFANRDSLFTIQFYARSPTPGPPYPQSGFDLVDGMVNSIISNSPSNWDYGAYINYIDDRLADWQKRYYGSHYARLRSLKRKFDPNGVFEFPTAIEI